MNNLFSRLPTEVVFLDEPSAGMDPAARHAMWDIIHQVAERHRAVVATTHSMEEADTLGDTIGVMSKGKLQACGTSLDLKAKYGLGYHLHIVRTEKGQSNEILRSEIQEKGQRRRKIKMSVSKHVLPQSRIQTQTQV